MSFSLQQQQLQLQQQQQQRHNPVDPINVSMQNCYSKHSPHNNFYHHNALHGPVLTTDEHAMHTGELTPDAVYSHRRYDWTSQQQQQQQQQQQHHQLQQHFSSPPAGISNHDPYNNNNNNNKGSHQPVVTMATSPTRSLSVLTSQSSTMRNNGDLNGSVSTLVGQQGPGSPQSLDSIYQLKQSYPGSSAPGAAVSNIVRNCGEPFNPAAAAAAVAAFPPFYDSHPHARPSTFPPATGFQFPHPDFFPSSMAPPASFFEFFEGQGTRMFNQHYHQGEESGSNIERYVYTAGKLLKTACIIP